MAFFNGTYKNYYEKLANITSNYSNFSSLFGEFSASFNNILNGISSSTWKELGKLEIENSYSSMVSNYLKVLNKENETLAAVCKGANEIYNSCSKLKVLDSKLSSYEEGTDAYNSCVTEIKSTMSDIDDKVAKLKAIKDDSEKVQKNSSSTTTETPAIDFSSIDTSNLTNDEIEKLRKVFIGDIDTDPYTVAVNATYENFRKYKRGIKARTLQLFYNGKVLKDGDTITIKKGETARITVKLPQDAGKPTLLRRTTADGYKKGNKNRIWEKYVSAHSTPHMDWRPECRTGTPVRTNHYDWIVTGKKVGQTSISQTAEYSSEASSRYIKAMVELKVNVVEA